MRNITYIVDKNGKIISAVLPIKTYNLIIAELKELENIRKKDKSKSKKTILITLTDVCEKGRKQSGKVTRIE